MGQARDEGEISDRKRKRKAHDKAILRKAGIKREVCGEVNKQVARRMRNSHTRRSCDWAPHM